LPVVFYVEATITYALKVRKVFPKFQVLIINMLDSGLEHY